MIAMTLSLFQAYEFDSLFARLVGIQKLTVSTFQLKPQGVCRPSSDFFKDHSLVDEEKKLIQNPFSTGSDNNHILPGKR